MNNDEPIKKVSIIISKGTLEGVYPGLILANGARMEGIEANLFFTFSGLQVITNRTMDRIKTDLSGNPALHLPAIIGAVPGVQGFVTRKILKSMEQLDIPPVREFIEMIHDSGCRIYACKASVDLFKLKKDDFCKQVDDVLTVGEFYEISAGASIIFT